jgi:hypothetical protein
VRKMALSVIRRSSRRTRASTSKHETQSWSEDTASPATPIRNVEPRICTAEPTTASINSEGVQRVCRDTPDGEMALIELYTFRVGASETSLSVQTLGHAGSA